MIKNARNRTITGWLVAALGVTTLVACGSDDTTTATSAASATTAASETTAPAETTAASETTAPPETTDASETTAPPETTAASSDAQSDLDAFLVPPTQLPSWPAITAEIPQDVTVFFINGGDDTATLIEEGVKGAATVLGWNYESVSIDRSPTGANSGILSALQAGADAIVMATADSSTITEALAAAKDQGVPIVQIGSTEPDAFTGIVDSINASADRWGQLMAAAVVADAEQKGVTVHVGTLTSAAFAALEPTRLAFIDHLGRYCADCTAEVIDAPASELFSGQASNSVISALQRNPDLNYVWFGLGLTSIGVRPALDSTGFESVRFVGFLPTPGQLQEMRDTGGVAGWVVVPNRYDGFVAVDAVVRSLVGMDPTIHNLEVEPAWVLTENSQFDPGILPELPMDYAVEFGKIWGVG